MLQLAEAFDQVTGGDLAWRWLREYYLADYRQIRAGSSKLIAEEFSREDIGSTWSNPRGPNYSACVTVEEAEEKFFSTVMDKEEKFQREEAQRLHAKLIPSEKIGEDAQAYLQRIRDWQKVMEENGVSNQEVMTLQRALVANGDVTCSDSDVSEEMLEWMDHLSRIDSSKAMIVSDADFLSFVLEPCEGRLSMESWDQKLASYVNILELISQQETTPGTQLHLMRVRRYMSSKAELESHMELRERQLYMTYSYKERSEATEDSQSQN